MNSVIDSVAVEATDAIRLVPIDGSHAEACFVACQDEEIHRWLPLPRPYTYELAARWCESGAEAYRLDGLGIHYAIIAGGAFVGCASYRDPRWREGIVEISYWVKRESRGRGVATASVRALALNAFAIGFQRVELRVAPGNDASHGVAKSARFAREGTLRSAGITHSGRVDLVLYSQIVSDVFS